MELIRDRHGILTGTIREIAGKRERLYTPVGKAVADYDDVTRATYRSSPRTCRAISIRNARRFFHECSASLKPPAISSYGWLEEQ